ncbi:MAG: 2-amino-4-hydroxy-6-hydroxymethyldihydropteridine diphosphokinase [Lachnospiraceae bacterium]|nr:2-amino-4-hydroxy-6-hydroxymethyldihydropteridine diphosphokinase [Lachnospiraceae bacterium]
MDQITIRNMEIFGYHGVFEEEAFLGQKFIVTAKLFLSVRQAGKTDDLKKSLDYGEACGLIKKLVETERYMLIESLAEEIAEQLLLSFPILCEVEITVKKPWAPVQVSLDTVEVTIRRGWHKAYLSIGSNIGDREGYLDFAIDRLNDMKDTKVTAVADYLETKPYGDVEQDDFLNGALEIETLKTPVELLSSVMAIEKEAGRERAIHWGPRTLDIDILFYDAVIIQEEDLVIPHVEIQKRLFVLEPLSTIAPFYIHPVYRKSVMDLLEELKQRGSAQ